MYMKGLIFRVMVFEIIMFLILFCVFYSDSIICINGFVIFNICFNFFFSYIIKF